MTPTAALQVLGANRTIWIDDHFADNAEKLADMLIAKVEVARGCNFEEIGQILVFDEENDDEARQDLRQALTDLSQTVRSRIKDAFLAKEREIDGVAGRELPSNVVDNACRMLGVKDEDRWTFDGAEEKLSNECSAGDAGNAYIIDLKDDASPAAISADRGLELLAVLAAGGSQGTPFILTHEATLHDEARIEAGIREKLKNNPRGIQSVNIPICVIAKDRIAATLEDEAISGGLCVAIKRAGLRRSMYEVLKVAKSSLEAAFTQAEFMLLDIAPEHLDSFVVQRAYAEGASDLHVVERALSASIGFSLRETFATNSVVQASSARLRGLRTVDLPSQPHQKPDKNLQKFRDYEIWESDTLLNSSLTPVTCGDVFEIDELETGKASSKRYLLLGQACDMALRPGKDRDQAMALLVPLKVKGETSSSTSPKKPTLPFRLDGKEWMCDFRNASPVQLAILDLASFRNDGRVRFDDQQNMSPQLLDAQSKLFRSRSTTAQQTIDRLKRKTDAGKQAEKNEPVIVVPGLQLTFLQSEEFKRIWRGEFRPATQTKKDGVTTLIPAKITWFLRRCGRVRVPYSSYLLDSYYRVMGRAAFDLDYTMTHETLAAVSPAPCSQTVGTTP